MKPTDPRHAPVQHPHDPEFMHNAGVAHEHSDINVRGIVVFCIGLTAIAVIVHVLMWGLFRFFDAHAASNDRPLSPVAVPSAQMPPKTTADPQFGTASGPRLLTNEYRVLDEHRRNEDQQLQAYGWADPKAGIARMPISEAKKLILERGLPVRAGDPVDPGLGTTQPARGEASSGRLTNGAPRGTGLPDVGAPPAAAKPPEHKGG